MPRGPSIRSGGSTVGRIPGGRDGPTGRPVPGLPAHHPGEGSLCRIATARWILERMSNSHQPVHISGRLDPGLSRWTWLVKWFLLIPHLIVLAVLWIALVVLSIVALVAVVVSGRYPSALFGFNAGVLRWSWRVAFYGYALGGTDRYPPFTLSDVPDYPARLDIERPERLSRPKALVKWWLLAIPHYLVVVLLVGAGRWEAPGTNVTTGVFGLGLIGVLVLIALVALLFTGRYPAGIFDAVMGMNRWVLRVAAYALLMTDVYPPFRLDQGGDDPPAVDDDRTGRRVAAGPERRSGGPLTPAASSAPGGATIVMDPPVDVVEVPDDVPPGARRPVSTTPAPPPSTARALLLVLGSVVTALGVLLGGLGTAGLVTDRVARDGGGFLATGVGTATTAGVALRTDPLQIDADRPDTPARVFGEVALRATSNRGGDVFVGIGPTADVSRYLAGAAQGVWRTGAFDGRGFAAGVDQVAGSASVAPPGEQPFWVARASGPGTTTMSWAPVPGDWTAVVMNADGTAPVSAGVQLAARVPVLGLASMAAFWTGVGLLVVGIAVIVGAATTGRRRTVEVAR
ncbi:hypothetical protein PSD17_00570 [Pseudonocardia sp. D17]|nr:hypothetical protein PSD17_00570 [Pseudonocardia sp. D17]